MSESMINEENEQRARMIIEKAQARSGLITVLTRRLECCDDLLARIAAENSGTIRTGEHSQRGLFDIIGEGESLPGKGGEMACGLIIRMLFARPIEDDV